MSPTPDPAERLRQLLQAELTQHGAPAHTHVVIARDLVQTNLAHVRISRGEYAAGEPFDLNQVDDTGQETDVRRQLRHLVRHLDTVEREAGQ